MMDRGWRAIVAMTVSGVGMLVACSPAVALPPPLGGLTPTGCFEDAGGTLCPAGHQVPGMGTADSVTVSPDGRNVYAGSADSLTTFNRGAGGALQPAGCVEAGTVPSTCGAATPGLIQPFSIAVSPDGATLYTTGYGGNDIVEFNRAANGALTPLGCIQDPSASSCGSGATTAAGLLAPAAILVSPDDKNVYVAAGERGGKIGDAVLTFNRGPGGALTLVGCIEDTASSACGAGATKIAGLKGLASIAMSPDGGSIYTASYIAGSVVRFNRSASGALSAATCIEATSSTACGAGAQQVAGLGGAISVAVSPGGDDVYVGSESSAVVEFARAAGGALSPVGCIESTASTACGPGAPTAAGLEGTYVLKVSPDGANVYVGASSAIVELRRAASGALTAAGCIDDPPAVQVCGPGNSTPGLDSPDQMAVSPDGASVYVSTENDSAVVPFKREVAPSCAPASAGTPHGLPVAIALRCTDLDLNPLTLSVVSGPKHGRVGSITAATGMIGYTPTPGYTGTDSFTYQASDGSLSSAPATVTVAVTAAVPVVNRLSQSHRTWRRGSRLAKAARARKPPVGTVFSFRLNEPASVRLSFVQGKRVRGTLRFAGRLGTNRISFSGRLSRSRRLKPGRYAVVVVATNSAGKRSKRASIKFTIVR